MQNQLLFDTLFKTALLAIKKHSPEVSDLQVSIPDMHLHVIPPKQVFPGNFAIGINMPIIRNRKKT